jgi:activator of HSP90 ATPase
MRPCEKICCISWTCCKKLRHKNRSKKLKIYATLGYTLLARANVALSVSVNTLSILLSAETMAVVFELYDHLLGAHFVSAVPTPAHLLRLTLMLALPLLAGMALRRIRIRGHPVFMRYAPQPVPHCWRH